MVSVAPLEVCNLDIQPCPLNNGTRKARFVEISGIIRGEY